MNSCSDRPDVSIIIPCYNRSSLIAKAIESALTQGKSIEVIVIDDGSVDDSWDKICSFGTSIRAFRQVNGGVSAARNAGIRYAQGRYIKFLDSDDLIPVGAVNALLKSAKRSGKIREIQFGDATTVDLEDQVTAGPAYGFAHVPTDLLLTRAAILGGTMSPYLPLFPRAALIAVGGFDERLSLSEDQELAVRLIAAGYMFRKVAYCVALVREHIGARLSRDGGAGRYERLLTAYTRIAHAAASLHPPLDEVERRALGGSIWTTGRDASRDRFRKQASMIFSLGDTYHGREAQHVIIRTLYKILKPYYSEHILELAKYIREGKRKI